MACSSSGIVSSIDPVEELALAESVQCAHRVAIEREHRLVFGNGLRISALRAQHLAFGEMRKRAAGRCRQGLPDQSFRARDVGCGRVGHFIEHAARERGRQPALRLDGPRIERQRALEQADRLRIFVTRRRLRHCGASPENVVQRVGILGRPGGLRADQREVERDRDPARDLVLQGEQIARVAVEPLGPQMRVGLGIDQLGVDADLVARRAGRCLRAHSARRARGRSALR